MHYKKIQYLTLTLGKVTQNVAKYPLHHVTYAPVCKFEFAMTNGLGLQLHEHTVFDLDLGVKVTWNVTEYPLHHMTYAVAIVEGATSTVYIV